jgi:hypothetical protein
MPKQGSSSGFKYGRAVGALEAVVALCEVPLTVVEPTLWKKLHGLRGGEKETSRQRALQLFPAAHALFARKQDHGRAEVALIASSFRLICEKRAGRFPRQNVEGRAMRKIVKLEEPRLIQGIILKCVDGRWSDADSLPAPAQLLVLGTTRALQRWHEKKPVNTIIELPNEPLPDVDELSAAIPETEWEVGLDGNPRPPWQLNWVVYLVNMETADVYTFLNSTTGARIAVERLADKFKMMRAMHGRNVYPIVQLDSRPMKTAFGQKLRPDFKVIEWRELEELEAVPPAALAQQPVPQLEQKAAERLANPQPAKGAKKASVGKTVKPVSTAEGLNDEISF